MSVGIAIGVGILLGGAVLVAAFEVADRFELNLFQVGDTA